MASSFALVRSKLQIFLTMIPILGAGVVLCLFAMSGVAKAASAQGPQCQSAFTTFERPLVPMNPLYVGENRGKYFDPITKSFWKVHYFTPLEKHAFELLVREGILVHREGQKAQSPFDPEAMSWENGLFIVDRDLRLFLLPFEERGRYHHSSLTGGKEVLFAGTAAFHQGYIREISDRSGHYKQTKEQTIFALKELARMGINLNHVRLTGHFIKEITSFYSLAPQEVPAVFPELFEKN